MSTTYLVRITGTHELHGFFVAKNTQDLFCVIDHHEDPGGCEYAVLPSGGIVLWDIKIPIAQKPTREQIDEQLETGDLPDLSFRSAELHPQWRDPVVFGDGLKWMTFEELNISKNPNWKAEMAAMKRKFARYAKKHAKPDPDAKEVA